MPFTPSKTSVQRIRKGIELSKYEIFGEIENNCHFTAQKYGKTFDVN